jgi:hypothetical protein
LFIDRELEDNIGLFSSLVGSVSNLGLENADISGRYSVGGISGTSGGLPVINNSYVTGSVGGVDSVGGVFGYGDADIDDVYFVGDVVSSGDYAGGIMGYGGGSIDNVYVIGDISATNSKVGGIGGNVGSSDVISNAYFEGSVSGASYVHWISFSDSIDSFYKSSGSGCSGAPCSGGAAAEVVSVGDGISNSDWVDSNLSTWSFSSDEGGLPGFDWQEVTYTKNGEVYVYVQLFYPDVPGFVSGGGLAGGLVWPELVAEFVDSDGTEGVVDFKVLPGRGSAVDCVADVAAGNMTGSDTVTAGLADFTPIGAITDGSVYTWCAKSTDSDGQESPWQRMGVIGFDTTPSSDFTSIAGAARPNSGIDTSDVSADHTDPYSGTGSVIERVEWIIDWLMGVGSPYGR